MIISTLLLLLAQDEETIRKRVGEFESKLQKLEEKERIPVARAWFAGLTDSATKIEALSMFDSRYVYFIPNSLESELIRPLLRDADPAVRVRAANAAAYTGRGGELAGELLALLAEKGTVAKSSALQAMGRSGSPKFATPLRDHLAHDDVAVRRAAAGAFGPWSVSQSAALTPLLKDPDAEVRAIAAVELGRTGLAAYAGDIAALLSDAQPNVRVAAIQALTSLRQHADLVRLRLDDADETVRGHAAIALGTMDAREHIDAVAALLKSANRGVRNAAVWSLSLFKDPSILRRLSPLLGDADETIRGQARERIHDWVASRDPDTLAREIDALVVRLGGEDAEERDRAQQDLIAVGRRAIHSLTRAEGNTERTSRARASLDEIRWGESMRTLQKRLDEANGSAERRFELRNFTSDASTRWFPACRVITLRCSWQEPKLSSVVWPKSYLLDPCWSEPYEGDSGLNRLLERYPVKIASLDEAKQFVAFMGSLGIPGGVPQRDTVVVSKTDSGFEGRRDFGKVADVYTLRVDGGVLRNVQYERR